MLYVIPLWTYRISMSPFVAASAQNSYYPMRTLCSWSHFRISRCCINTPFTIPWATLPMEPLEHLEVSLPRSQGKSVTIPRATLLTEHCLGSHHISTVGLLDLVVFSLLQPRASVIKLSSQSCTPEY
jgi:hypothetical protein